jgi:hypothetical protein
VIIRLPLTGLPCMQTVAGSHGSPPPRNMYITFTCQAQNVTEQRRVGYRIVPLLPAHVFVSCGSTRESFQYLLCSHNFSFYKSLPDRSYLLDVIHHLPKPSCFGSSRRSLSFTFNFPFGPSSHYRIKSYVYDLRFSQRWL